MYELTPQKLGQFDIVLFLGVLYHLKHPLLALERVCALSPGYGCDRGTYTSPDSGPPMMEFFEIDELGGQFDNWVAPNPACLQAMCRTAGFARVDLLDVNKHGSSVMAYRRFADAEAHSPAPVLKACVNMTRFGPNVSSQRDDYASCWFLSDEATLDRESVQARVGPFDAGPVFVARDGDAWQINFKIPLGLDPGWHEVSVRTSGSVWSDQRESRSTCPSKLKRFKLPAPATVKSGPLSRCRPACYQYGSLASPKMAGSTTSLSRSTTSAARSTTLPLGKRGHRPSSMCEPLRNWVREKDQSPWRWRTSFLSQYPFRFAKRRKTGIAARCMPSQTFPVPSGIYGAVP